MKKNWPPGALAVKECLDPDDHHLWLYLFRALTKVYVHVDLIPCCGFLKENINEGKLDTVMRRTTMSQKKPQLGVKQNCRQTVSNVLHVIFSGFAHVKPV